jgi:hypothetical protein
MLDAESWSPLTAEAYSHRWSGTTPAKNGRGNPVERHMMLHVLALMALALLGCRGEDRTLTASTASTANAPSVVSRASALARDMPSAWNERLMAVAIAEDSLLTLKGVRTAAMLNLALHDALNAVVRVYAPYAHDSSEPGADPIAAAAQAAYRVALSQYPDARDGIEQELRRWLDAASRGDASSGAALEAARSRGIALGDAAAAAVLQAREGDGWNAEVPYEPRPPAPGVYVEFPEHSGTPPGFVFGTGFGRARPFMLERADQFRAPPPPPLESEAYAEAFNEVRELGRAESPTRTADQTHIAFFWKEFAESSLGRLGRELARERGLGLWEASRLFALIHAGIFDGYVSVFDSKLFYDHWRPYTAIRAAESDGNPATAPDASWDNTHHHTYPFPSYPSAHGTVCAASFAALSDVFGDELDFTMSTPRVSSGGPLSESMEMVPPTRSFASFSEAARECALSRVYLGIHFRYDSEAGNELGTRVGEVAVARLARAP